MSGFFLSIVNMSISASWIVLAVLLLRILLKKAPKWITVLLWGIVAIRLICPFSIESVMSLIPSAETITKAPDAPRPHFESGFTIIDNQVNDYLGGHYYEGVTRPTGHFVDITTILAVVWLVGIVVLLAYTIISYFRVKNKIGTAVLLRDNIYQSENVVSPFVLGIIKPKIYLPFNMNEQDMEHVIAHENAHIHRKDHWWKPFGFLVLTLHWFNPLMWLGYVLLCRDIELACDEKVVKEFNNEQKADYSQALLTCSVSRRIIAACPLAFGVVGVKNRVKSVLNYKKPAFWIVVAAIVASLVVAVCFLTNPKTTMDDELSVFIDTQVADHHSDYKYSKDYNYDNFIAVNCKVLEVDKSADKTIVYLWAMYHEYSFENGVVKLETAAHIPTVITAKQEDKHGHYKLVEYWEPHDGELFESDIKGKFPVHLHSKALNSQLYDDEQRAFCENAAKEYYSTSNIGSADSTNVQTFESTVSYANWSDDSKIYVQALNTDKMSINSVQHLPIYKFDTLKDLEQFKNTFGSLFTMDSGYDEVPSFNSVTKKYDNAFFEENSLLLVYVSAGNCTHRFKMQNVGYDNKSFSVHVVETTNAEFVDTAMAGWFITVAVSDDLIKTVTSFDADLNNAIDISLPKYEGDKVIDVPPTLVVVSNGQSIEALKGTSSWIHEGTNGMSEAVMSDSGHPLMMKKSMPSIDVLTVHYATIGDPLQAKIQFNAKGVTPVYEVPPDEIYIRCWEEKHWGKTNAKSENINPTIVNGNLFFDLKDGNYIYEVVATWSTQDKFSGTAQYSFYTLKSNANSNMD